MNWKEMIHSKDMPLFQDLVPWRIKNSWFRQKWRSGGDAAAFVHFYF